MPAGPFRRRPPPGPRPRSGLDILRPETAVTAARGFVEPIAKELPMEYALELNRLIELQMEGSVG